MPTKLYSKSIHNKPTTKQQIYAMWNNDEEVNEYGDPVKLYLPTKGPPRKTNTAPPDSHIGGHCFLEDVTATCDKCQDPMYLLVQLRIKPVADQAEKNDRYACLFACPKEECFSQMQYDKGFSSGGQGLVKCVVRSVPEEVAAEATKPAPVPVAPVKSSWYADDDNDWGMNDGDETNAEALADAVAAMEKNLDADGALASLNKPTSKQATKQSKPSSNESLENGFGCYILTTQNEPLPARPVLEDDDVGMGESDEKIRNMLARYMAEEEDEDILAALQGTEIGGGGKGEEDERLSEEDRVLRGFQDRLRRVPRQVIRYALNGTPLWSIPDKNRKTDKQLWNVPDGAVFEFQVLPSILATLDVDKVSKSKGKAVNSKQALDEMLTDGMNFGSIAVFTHPNSEEATVVIQKSVDDLPEQMRQASQMEMPAATEAVMEDLDDDDEFELDG